ncbi:MAG: PH domain-containing protein, partial [candidate division Zixibacteria bacterium]|nr:PH domain-containing protein [candidate division Zixibacteria bacterium]
RAKLHWAIFILGIVLLPLFGLGLIFLIAALIQWVTIEMAVTNKRVIIKKGLISQSTVEMNLAKIENIQVVQGILGRMLGYGTIVVVGTGGTHERFGYVAAPLDFRKAVQGQSH